MTSELTQNFTVINKMGLHIRPAADFIKIVKCFNQNSVWIENLNRNSHRVDAKSISKITSLAISQNDEIRITIDGPDPESVMKAIEHYFKLQSGEDQ